jgi:hypothetical protein
MGNILSNLLSDLHEAYPSVACASNDPIKLLKAIHKSTGERFMFVIDDWDFIFNSESGSKSKFASKRDLKNYEKFLDTLLDGDYLCMSYITGVAPLPNNYLNFSREFTRFFGFNGVETASLIKRYNAQFQKGEKKNVSFDSLRHWYKYDKICNPYSTVMALKSNKLDFYWFDSAPKNELWDILNLSWSIGSEIAYLIARVLIQKTSVQNVDIPFDIFSNEYLVLLELSYLGYLTIHRDEECPFHVPNHEIYSKLEEFAKFDSKYSYIYELATIFPYLRDAIFSLDKSAVANVFDEKLHSEKKTFYTSELIYRKLMASLAFLGAADYDITQCDDKALFALVPKAPAKAAIIFEFLEDTLGSYIAFEMSSLKTFEPFNSIRGQRATYTGKVYLVAISFDDFEKTILCDIEVV